MSAGPRIGRAALAFGLFAATSARADDAPFAASVRRVGRGGKLEIAQKAGPEAPKGARACVVGANGRIGCGPLGKRYKKNLYILTLETAADDEPISVWMKVELESAAAGAAEAEHADRPAGGKPRDAAATAATAATTAGRSARWAVGVDAIVSALGPARFNWLGYRERDGTPALLAAGRNREAAGLGLCLRWLNSTGNWGIAGGVRLARSPDRSTRSTGLNGVDTIVTVAMAETSTAAAVVATAKLAEVGGGPRLDGAIGVDAARSVVTIAEKRTSFDGTTRASAARSQLTPLSGRVEFSATRRPSGAPLQPALRATLFALMPFGAAKNRLSGDNALIAEIGQSLKHQSNYAVGIALGVEVRP